MTQLDIVKAFLDDADIQAKYNLPAAEAAQVTMSSQHGTDAQLLVGLIRHFVSVTEDASTINLAANRLNAHLENVLR